MEPIMHYIRNLKELILRRKALSASVVFHIVLIAILISIPLRKSRHIETEEFYPIDLVGSEEIAVEEPEPLESDSSETVAPIEPEKVKIKKTVKIENLTKTIQQKWEEIEKKNQKTNSPEHLNYSLNRKNSVFDGTPIQ